MLLIIYVYYHIYKFHDWSMPEDTRDDSWLLQMVLFQTKLLLSCDLYK